ncbi:MAG TPA: 16S rRNA (adenine(1518)-N(6)/adenine(1519)-N(6))-dimethyltransferase RsmA [Terriglobia bacterium]|nr:16S rRNA (adenine(1518)-N(6)/adenine(1519)-N(6))-dimethyltransferase RsmA [Terriglobia bacterium]
MASRRRPKLGQHFLADPRFRRRIVDALPLSQGELVVEIGPGRGAMTGLLVERASRVVAIELDSALVEALRREFHGETHLEVIETDILATDIGQLCRERHAEKCFVFGNIPYYITSPILHHLFGFHASICGMALLMQYEVAARLIARPGRREYGYLTVLARAFSSPRLLLQVPPGAFSPPPQVSSALVGFEMRPPPGALPTLSDASGLGPGNWDAGEVEQFLGFVQACFAQKRKRLLNNLGRIYGREAVEVQLDRVGLAVETRAEELDVAVLADLFVGLENCRLTIDD